MLDLVLQWLGFAGIIAGALMFHRSKLACCLLYIAASSLLLAWCLLQPEIPWGVAGVQLVSVVAWGYNLGMGVRHYVSGAR